MQCTTGFACSESPSLSWELFIIKIYSVRNLMKKMLLLSLIFGVLPFFGCVAERPAAPMCRTTAPDSQGSAAACIIRSEQQLLFIDHRLSGKLDVPGGGRREDESLPCAAHRETWEETGLNVEVGPQAGRTSHGMVLYICWEQANLAALPDRFEPPPWADVEVSDLVKADPFSLQPDNLRFADDLIPFRDAFVFANDHQP